MPDAMLPRLVERESVIFGFRCSRRSGIAPPDCKAKSAPNVASLAVSVFELVIEEEDSR